jgi:methyl-accepting chemotaxis protein
MSSTLTIRSKLAIVVAIFCLPILLLGYFFVMQSMKDIAFAGNERDGVAYAKATAPGLFGIQKLAAGLEAEVDFATIASDIAAAGDRFDAAMRTGPARAELVEHLTHLEKESKQEVLSAEYAEDAQHVVSFFAAINDGSNLILDPDLDSYYLMDVAMIRLPELLTAVQQIERAGAANRLKAGKGEKIGFEQILAAGSALTAIDVIIASAERSISSNSNGHLESEYRPALDAFKTKAMNLRKELVALRDGGIERFATSSGSTELSAASRQLLEAAPAFWAMSANCLDKLLAVRIAGFWSKLWLGLGICLAAILIALGLAAFFMVSISRSIVALSNSIDKAASDAEMQETPFIHDKTEIGVIARAVDRLRIFTTDKLNGEHAAARDEAVREKAREAAAEIAAELRATVMDAIEDMNRLASALGARTLGLSKASSSSIAEMGSASSRLSSTTMSIASVSSMITEFTHSIADINQQTQRYVGVAEEASQSSRMVSVNVRDLTEATSRIGSIVDTIAGIASQTNLLALNATIEAARAGDAGRGFSVVAAEVKALAQTTAAATLDITKQIRSIEIAANGFGVTVDVINETITTLSEISTAIAVAIGQQKSASNELDQTVHSVAADADNVNNSVTAVVDMAKDVGAQSADIDALAQELANRAMVLQDKADALIFKLMAA